VDPSGTLPAQPLVAALAALRCPVCATPLVPDSQALRCENRHVFDIARQGYVNLDVGNGRAGTADTPAMVAARQRFLGRGHYAPIADALRHFASRFAPDAQETGIVLDLAGGTGYYLCAVLGSVRSRVGICMDLSKPALRRAARVHPRAAAVGSDVWRDFPLADQSAAIVTSAFGPRNTAETIRVLSPGGVFLLVTPTARHLSEVIEPLGMLSVDPVKEQRLAASMSDLGLITAETLTFRTPLSHLDLSHLVAMGPSAYHVNPAQLADRLTALPDPLPVTVSVSLAAYRPAILRSPVDPG